MQDMLSILRNTSVPTLRKYIKLRERIDAMTKKANAMLNAGPAEKPAKSAKPAKAKRVWKKTSVHTQAYWTPARRKASRLRMRRIWREKRRNGQVSLKA